MPLLYLVGEDDKHSECDEHGVEVDDHEVENAQLDHLDENIDLVCARLQKCIAHTYRNAYLRARKYLKAVGFFFTSSWCVHFEVMHPNSREMVL